MPDQVKALLLNDLRDLQTFAVCAASNRLQLQGPSQCRYLLLCSESTMWNQRHDARKVCLVDRGHRYGLTYLRSSSSCAAFTNDSAWLASLISSELRYLRRSCLRCRPGLLASPNGDDIYTNWDPESVSGGGSVVVTATNMSMAAGLRGLAAAARLSQSAAGPSPTLLTQLRCAILVLQLATILAHDGSMVSTSSFYAP